MAAVLILLLLAGMPFLDAQPALAQSVSLSSSSGQPGTSITVSGTGFVNGDTYQIIFAPGTTLEQLLAPTTIISGTSFSRVVTVPYVPYGQYTIRIASNRGNFSPAFQIIPMVGLNISTGFVGDMLLISGAGFNANRTVNVYFNNNNIAATSSNALGNLNPVGYQVPALRGQSYNIYASDGIVSSPSVIFTVRPLLTASLLQGFVGDQVKLDGTGFDDNSGITIYWDNELFASGISSNSAGSFTVTITIPPDNRGSHSIMARDSLSSTDVVSFLISPRITISPNSGAYGSVINITGNGFRANAIITITYDGVAVSGQAVTFIADVSGSFSGSFVLPSLLAGSYTLRASDGLYAATTPIAVSSRLELSVSSGNVGTRVMVYGTGFTPGGRVIISYDNQTILDINADTAGSVSGSFSVPVSAAGQHSVTAQDVASGIISASAVFIMESVPPAVPGPLTPQNNTQAGVTPAFAWSMATDPSGVTYDLQVARDAGFSQLVIYKQGLTLTEYQAGPSETLELTKSTSPYYWRVRAVDGAGNVSAWADASTFYTQDSTPPPVPVMFNPPHESQADLRPTFIWSAVTDPGNVTYDLQVSADAGFSQLVIYKQGLTMTEYQPEQPEALQLTKKTDSYYWRVRAVDEVDNASDWTSPASFYTQDSTPPPVPAPLSPESGSTEGRNTLFEWADVADPGAVTYDLEVAQDAAFSQLLISKEGLSVSEYRLSGEESLNPTSGDPENPYYWRVRSVDADLNASDWSTSSGFYVRGFLQWGGWALYLVIIIGGILLIGIGVLVGMRIRPAGKPSA